MLILSYIFLKIYFITYMNYEHLEIINSGEKTAKCD